MDYAIHLLVIIGIYLILAHSLNLVIGFCGLLSLCHAAFYGIGAYVFALCSMKLGFSFLPALALAFLCTGAISYILSFSALRFRGDSFVLVSLGFQMIIFTILYNWVGVTKGPFGIPGIPRPVLFGFRVNEPLEYLILVAVVNVIVFSSLFVLYRSPFGLVLKTIREDEKAAESLGKPAFAHLSIAFTLGGAFAAVAGSLFASYITYIDPTSFTLNESLFIVVILLLGGSGNKRGPFVGTVLIVLLPEALRFMGLPNSIAPNIREMIYGVILILLMFFRPQGISGEYSVR